MTRLTFAMIALLAAPAFGALPVVPASDQAVLLKSKDKKLAANKKAAYDFYRIVLRGLRLDQAEKYMRDDYIQHNPNADTGMYGFKAYFTKLGGPKDIPATIEGLVAIQAEGDYVTMSFVREYDDPAQKGHLSEPLSSTPYGKYTTTWFDMFRFDSNGKIAEHWDSALKAAL
jgi:predicted SnoaL-like aldol condensation-catalyzing enzyme